MTTIQDVYDDVHMKQVRLVRVSNLTPISQFLNELSKDFPIQVTDVHIDNTKYSENYVWLVDDVVYKIRVYHGSFATLWGNKVVMVGNKFTLLTHFLSYTNGKDYIQYSKYDDTTGFMHCASGPASLHYDKDRNGNRRLTGVRYLIQGKTFSEKAYNKKFGTNFDHKNQIEMEKVFKIFGKKFKIAHVDSAKENVRLVPYV